MRVIEANNGHNIDCVGDSGNGVDSFGVVE